jgi:hypothetical protein
MRLRQSLAALLGVARALSRDAPDTRRDGRADDRETRTDEGDRAMKKTVAFVMALSLAALAGIVSNAEARRGADDPKRPPKCEVEDRGVIRCR